MWGWWQEDEECHNPVCDWVVLLPVPAPPPLPDPCVQMEEEGAGEGEAEEEGGEEEKEDDGQEATRQVHPLCGVATTDSLPPPPPPPALLAMKGLMVQNDLTMAEALTLMDRVPDRPAPQLPAETLSQ